MNLNIKVTATAVITVIITSLIVYSVHWWKKTYLPSRIVDSEDSYINAKYFRDELIKAGSIDSMYTNDKRMREFLANRVKVIRNNEYDIQAISIPIEPARGNYYLIVNDSIFKLRIIRIKAAF